MKRILFFIWVLFIHLSVFSQGDTDFFDKVRANELTGVNNIIFGTKTLGNVVFIQFFNTDNSTWVDTEPTNYDRIRFSNDLTVSWSNPIFVATSSLTDPMTTRGDIIYRDNTNTTNRLALGNSGRYLGSNGVDLMYRQILGSEINNTEGWTSVSALSDLTDVNVATPSNGQVLVYNITNSRFENVDASTISTPVTLAGTLDYLTISGQEITRNAIDLTTDVTGVLPDANVANNITLDNITQITNRSHTNLTDIGTNTHLQIDNHIASTANPHNTSIANLGTGTLAQLNTKITDATLDGSTSPRTPTAHAASHQDGGTDEINVTGLSGRLAERQIVGVQNNGVLSGQRTQINFLSGNNITYMMAEDAVNDRVNVTINAANTTPGGTNGQVQYNNSGAFGGFGNWDGDDLTVQGSDLPSVSTLITTDPDLNPNAEIGALNFNSSFNTTGGTERNLAYIQANATDPHVVGDNSSFLSFGITPTGTQLVQEAVIIDETGLTTTNNLISSGNIQLANNQTISGDPQNRMLFSDSENLTPVTLSSLIGGGGTVSPLTTKGDLYSYTTTDARLPVGTDGQVLKANSSTMTGLEWVNASDGVTSSIVISPTDNSFTPTFSGSSQRFIGQSFLLNTSATVDNIVMYGGSSVGSPNFNIRVDIYNISAGLPSTKIYESTNVIAASTFAAGGAQTFNFSGAELTAGSYAFVTAYTDVVAHDISNSVSIAVNSTAPYADGVMLSKIGAAAWTQVTSLDLRATINLLIGGIVSDNIYTADGTLTSNRNVSLGNNNLTFSAANNTGNFAVNIESTSGNNVSEFNISPNGVDISADIGGEFSDISMVGSSIDLLTDNGAGRSSIFTLSNDTISNTANGIAGAAVTSEITAGNIRTLTHSNFGNPADVQRGYIFDSNGIRYDNVEQTNWTDSTLVTKAYVDATAGGGGDVTGPASTLDNALARFDGTTGKIIQTSNGIMDDAGNLNVSGSYSIAGNSINTAGTLTNIPYLNSLNTFSLDQSVPVETYGSGWENSFEVPTKGDLYAKIESLVGGATDFIAISEVQNSFFVSHNLTNVLQVGQSFRHTTDFSVSFIDMYGMGSIGSPDFDVRIEIWSTSGGLPSAKIYESTNVQPSSNWFTNNTNRFLFTNATLSANTDYAFITTYLNVTSHTSANHITIAFQTGNVYGNGSAMFKDGASAWALSSNNDLRSTVGIVETGTPGIVTSVNTQTGTVVLDTDDISEGTTNLYNRVPTGGTAGQVLSKVDATNYNLQWSDAASGTGDVVGPASSTDHAVARFDGTTGKLVQNSGVTINDNNIINVNSTYPLNLGGGVISIGGNEIRYGRSGVNYLTFPTGGSFSINETNSGTGTQLLDVNSSFLNIPGEYRVNDVPINTAGTLSNVAYLNQSNTFTNTGNTSFAGNVGIGTSLPDRMFHVEEATAGGTGYIRVSSAQSGNAAGAFVELEGWTGTASVVNSILGLGNVNGGMRFNTAGTPNAIMILGNGNVGIGTVNPITTLQVDGMFSIGPNGGSVMPRFSRNSTGGIHLDRVSVSTGVVDRNLISISGSNGFMGLGITDPDERLEIAGRINLNQTTAPVTTTDKLYNVGGDLFWDGTQLGTGGGGGASVLDLVGYQKGGWGASATNTLSGWGYLGNYTQNSAQATAGQDASGAFILLTGAASVGSSPRYTSQLIFQGASLNPTYAIQFRPNIVGGGSDISVGAFDQVAPTTISNAINLTSLGGGNFFFRTESGGTATLTDTGVALSNNAFKFVCEATVTSVNFWLYDASGTLLSSATHTTNIPTSNLVFGVVCRQTTTDANGFAFYFANIIFKR